MDDRDEQLRQYLSTKYLTTPPEDVTPASVTTTADDNTDGPETESTPGNAQAESHKDDYATAADDSGVKEAQASRNRAELIANVGRSLSNIFTARAQANGYKPDDSVYASIAKSGQSEVDEAQAARQNAIKDYLAKRQMSREDVADTRQLGLDAGARTQRDWENAFKTDQESRRADEFNASNDRLSEVNKETARHNRMEEYLAGQRAKDAGEKAKPFEYTDAKGNKRSGKIVGTQIYQDPNNDPIVTPALGDAPFKQLPVENQEVIKDLSKKNASKLGIANQIDAALLNWDKMPDDQKVTTGRQLLKILNSAEGADAIGAEEARRLGGKLETAFGNFTNSNPTQFGRDLPGFKTQAENQSTAIRTAVKSNEEEIARRQAPAAAPTATGKNGEKYILKDGAWVQQ